MTKKEKYTKEFGNDKWVMGKFYTDSSCTKTHWIKAKYCGEAFGWVNEKGSHIGNEHPDSKYSNPLRILSLEEYNRLFDAFIDMLDKMEDKYDE